jgi:hypothetical protein
LPHFDQFLENSDKYPKRILKVTGTSFFPAFYVFAKKKVYYQVTLQVALETNFGLRSKLSLILLDFDCGLNLYDNFSVTALLIEIQLPHCQIY